MRKLCLATASLLIILHSPLARAAEELPPPIVFVKTFLQLSEEQTAALVTMIQSRDATLRPIAMKLHSDQEALGKLVDSPAADPAAVGRLLLDIHSGEKQLAAAAQEAASAFEAVLSPNQIDRLQFLRQAAQVEPAIPIFKAIGLI